MGPFGSSGDSGSLVVDDFGVAVGLLFAAQNYLECRNPLTLVIPIENVLRDMENVIQGMYKEKDGRDAVVKVELV